jgi:aminoglycoside phosphotransferase (APT) family kinase protein
MTDQRNETPPPGEGADIIRTRREAAAMDRPPLLVLEAVEAFLDQHGLGIGPMHARLIGDGHSNPTFLLVRGDDHFVLRRPPRPPLPPSAHDVLREYRVTAALADSAVRVARPFVACEDSSLLGVPFYVMEYLDGEVAATTIPSALDEPSGRRGMAEQLIDALATLHTCDWRAAGLVTFGRPDGFLERQVARFTALWERNKTRELSELDEVRRRLDETVPVSRHASIVHGDYRLGNVMFAAEAPARLLAIFDWELATVGDPLTDLGYLLSSYRQPVDGSAPLAAIASLTSILGQEVVLRFSGVGSGSAVGGRRARGLWWFGRRCRRR